MATGTIKSSIRNYSISPPYALTQDVNYTCPSDGYFKIMCSSAAGSYCYGLVNSTQLMVISTPTTVPTTTDQIRTMFVRKGLKIKFVGSTGATGYFFPIVEQ